MALLINDNCTACDACKPVCPERGDQRRRPDLRHRSAALHRMRRRRGRAAVQARLPRGLHRASIRTFRKARRADGEVRHRCTASDGAASRGGGTGNGGALDRRAHGAHGADDERRERQRIEQPPTSSRRNFPRDRRQAAPPATGGGARAAHRSRMVGHVHPQHRRKHDRRVTEHHREHEAQAKRVHRRVIGRACRAITPRRQHDAPPTASHA